MTPHPGTILAGINNPADLRLLSTKQLLQLADELRAFILDVVSANPGHLGASLGVVELTIALHHVFNTPVDKLIWDVGHQAYGHKILTGRRDNFHSLRRKGGISGFPVMTESAYDAFGTGHASTAISAALGMAVADMVKGNNQRQYIAVVGDGALTGGMAFEGLNHAGSENANLLVILNDNGIAIDKSAGALKDYLLRQAKVPSGNPLFASFNFQCTGPIDGHDLPKLIETLNRLKGITGPRLLHVLTTKGKGFAEAENNQVLYHAPGTFDRQTGERPSQTASPSTPPLYQDVFGETIVDLATENPHIVAITPAMPTGSSLMAMMEKFPERVFDVGIAEQHAVTFAAGLAVEGLLPYCTIYSSFLQRAYDQVIHDVALQQLPVVLCIDRGGLVGEDGATHHGVFDLAFLQSVPGMRVAAPMNETELRNLLYSAQFTQGPFAIRYPRGKATIPAFSKAPFERIETGRGRCLHQGEKVAVISIGHPGNFVTEAISSLEKEGISPAHYDLRFLKPLDSHLLNEVFGRFEHIITVEDGVLQGGMGSTLMAFAQDNGFQVRITRLGIPDSFITHGTPQELYALCGFDAAGIAAAIRLAW